MPDYLVTWAINIEDAADEVEAAEKALAIQRDPDSTATVFEVLEVGYHNDRTMTIDLDLASH
jgi:hypothetical protein